MPYFAMRPTTGWSSAEVWEITETEAVKLNVTNPRQGPSSFYEAAPGEDIFDAIRRQNPVLFRSGNPFVRLAVEPNCFFPRMSRSHPNQLLALEASYPGWEADRDIAMVSRGQLTALVGMLDRICQTVHPAPDNLRTYGHELRNLLILAATEAEAQWRGVLTRNGARARTTNDYVKLLGPMRLAEYEVELTRFPWLGSIKPFASWDPAAPTRSLGWYEAYNATKHDREGSFAMATLRHCFDALAAVVALLVAQFGMRALGYGLEALAQPRETWFRFVRQPEWPLNECYYSVGGSGRGWRETRFPFAD